MADNVQAVLGGLDQVRDGVEALYRDLHAHPELGFQEHRTAGRVAEELRACGYEVTGGLGTTGVVGTLSRGAGPTVLLRADMDALVVRETTGLPCASTVTAEQPVMHACGHEAVQSGRDRAGVPMPVFGGIRGATTRAAARERGCRARN